MNLDFTTLYVIILINSLGFALVWGIICISYSTLYAARYWFLALIMTFLSGPILLLGEIMPGWNHIGNMFVIVGFGLIWQGIRVFLDKPPLWRTLSLALTVSFLTMIFFGTSQPISNLIYAVAQVFLIGMALLTLLTFKNQQAGTWVASVSFAILLLGQGSEAFTNAMRVAGFMSTETYYEYGAWFLVCAIIGISISNLGFLLMAVDRLRNELHTLATCDELTSLPNRRALNSKLLDIENKAIRSQENVAVFMMDVDRFKSINDTHGHQAGDAALKHIVEAIKTRLRKIDFLARIGGDEFCILIPDVDLNTANRIADKLISAVSSKPFEWQGTQTVLSISIGYSIWLPSSGSTLTSCLKTADENLMKYKREAQLAHAGDDKNTYPVFVMSSI